MIEVKHLTRRFGSHCAVDDAPLLGSPADEIFRRDHLPLLLTCF
jgi:hypothetical protein